MYKTYLISTFLSESTGHSLLPCSGSGELSSSSAGGSGGGGELAPDPGRASACGEGCFSGQNFHKSLAKAIKSLLSLSLKANL